MPEVVQVICFAKKDSDGIQTDADVDPLNIEEWKQKEEAKLEHECEMLIPEMVIGTSLDHESEIKLEDDPIHVEPEPIQLQPDHLGPEHGPELMELEPVPGPETELSIEPLPISIDPEQADQGTEDETVTDHGHVLIEPETVLVPETSVDLEPDFEPDPGLRNALELPVRIRLSSTTTTTAKLLPAANNKKRKKLSQSKSGPPGKKNRTKAPSKSVRSQVDEAGDVGAKPETAGPQLRVKMDELRFFYCEGTRWGSDFGWELIRPTVFEIINCFARYSTIEKAKLSIEHYKMSQGT